MQNLLIRILTFLVSNFRTLKDAEWIFPIFCPKNVFASFLHLLENKARTSCKVLRSHSSIIEAHEDRTCNEKTNYSNFLNWQVLNNNGSPLHTLSSRASIVCCVLRWKWHFFHLIYFCQIIILRKAQTTITLVHCRAQLAEFIKFYNFVYFYFERLPTTVVMHARSISKKTEKNFLWVNVNCCTDGLRDQQM